MVRIKLKYVVEDVDRHGNIRFYFRRKGQSKIRIRGMPGSEEFMEAYRNALANSPEDRPRIVGHPMKDSFGYVCLAYYASSVFTTLDAATQKQRRHFLDSICKDHGNKPISKMEAKHIETLLEGKRKTPAAARNLLKSLKALFVWAIKNKEVADDPTRNVRPISYFTKGHHTWTTEEVDQFEQQHPLGTMARLAMTIMLYTGCRREDVVRLGPQSIKNGQLRYTQAKNEHKDPVDIVIPVHPNLAAAIAACASGHTTFLITAHGKPFTPAGFGNKFRQWCDEAGLRECSSHGLRKATATRLAEGGASSQEIMSVTGHKSLPEVERYTKEANKTKLADSAMKKFK